MAAVTERPVTEAATPPAAPARFPAWEAQLAAQRGTLNAILAGARSAGASADALRAAMRELGPPVETLLSVLPSSAADSACRALTELVCDLVVRKAWHERSAERWAVLSVLPHLPHAVARSPRTTIEVVVRGAGRIVRETDLGAWGARLRAADALLADDDALRAGAAVAAWRSGLVRVRGSALTAARTLDGSGEALRVLLDLEGSDVAPRAALATNAADPFAWPGAPERGTVATYGGYRAFGGPWTGVPVVLGSVAAPTPTWRVLADGIGWVVVADVFGHVVLREPSGAAAGAPASALPASTLPAPGRAASAAPSDLLREVAAVVPWEDEITGAVPGAAPRPSAGRPVLVSRATSYRLDLVLVPSDVRAPATLRGAGS